MKKEDVAAILEEIGVLLELKGENPFKTRAYHNAARLVKSLSADLVDLVQSGEIRNIKGIGSALADKITELVTTGRLEYYENLRAEFPDSLLELLRIPGLGPKKIKKLYEELGIQSIKDLELACRKHQLAALEGFGARTEQKILEGIQFIKQHSDRHLYHVALAAGERLFQHVAGHPAVIRAQLAGSLRRCKETVKDIDIVASAEEKDRDAIMEHFTQQPGVQTVVAKGSTKSSIITEEGIQADLRIVSDKQFPYALHHFTGSREHNTAMRSHARKLGIKMNEYGLFREDESLIPCRNEEEIFAALGMDYIPPELREDMGEIEAALEHRLPKLVETSEIRGIIHAHTTESDGANTLEEMVEACRKMGMQYLGISDHSQSVYYANGLSVERLREQRRRIDELNQKYPDFRIFHGTECDILSDGSLDYPDEVLAELDFVIISVHQKLNMSEQEATERIIKAMAHPLVTILGHPTGRLLLSREGYPLNYAELFVAAKEYNVIIEINANPHRFDLDWRYVREARDQGIMLSINPDAHSVAGLSDTFLGVGIARKGWLTAADVLNTHSAEEVEKIFAKKKGRPAVS